MSNKKNGFFTFCTSLIPGAGEMYMGLYKQGLSLMVLFWGIISLGGYFRMEMLFFLLPVIWLYSFFHTHNLKRLAEEEFLAIEDKYLCFNDMDMEQWENMVSRNKKLIAVVLIFFGACLLGEMAMRALEPFISGFLWDVARMLNHYFARAIIAVAVIAIGIKMLKQKQEGMQEESTETVK